MTVKHLLINLHDNNFYLSMCILAETLINLFDVRLLNLSEQGKIVEFVKKQIATYTYLKSGQSYDSYLKYFSNKTTILFDIDEIVGHIERYSMDSNLEISGLYNSERRSDNPSLWLENLQLNLNSECILIQFIEGSDKNNSTSYRLF